MGTSNISDTSPNQFLIHSESPEIKKIISRNDLNEKNQNNINNNSNVDEENPENISYKNKDSIIVEENQMEEEQALSKEVSKESSFFKNEENSNVNCLICFEKPADAVFMNCGHGGL